MEGVKLKEEIFAIKDRLDNIENNLNSQIAELKLKEEKWKVMDNIAEEIRSKENLVIKFNINGKRFMTKIQTLLSQKDTLFYKMIISQTVDLKEEIFFDLNPKIFGIILDYLRYKKINLNRFNKDQLAELRRESEFFEVHELLEQIGGVDFGIEIVSYQFSGPYNSGGVVIGTNKVEDLNDRSMMKGICCNSPAWIVLELNNEWEINAIEVGGYRGNTSYWSVENGAYASIKTSIDQSTWIQVGSIPSGYGSSIKTVTFSPVKARYIKFEYTSYLGLGFVKVCKL